MSTTQKPFIQLVSLNANDRATRDKLLSLLQPCFAHVLSKEAPPNGTLVTTYQGFLPAGDPAQQETDTEFVAFETYSSEEEFNQQHMTAPPVKELIAAALGGLLNRPPSLNHLEFSGVGFHTRGAEREAEVKKSGKKPWTLLVTITTESSEGVDKVIEALKELAAYVEKDEPNTLTYEILRSKNNPKDVIIFERYVDRKDLDDVHWKSPLFLALGEKLKALGVVTGKTARTYEDQLQGVWGKE